MYLDYNLKVLLWCTFIFLIIGLAYIGGTSIVKEGFEANPTCNATCACFDKCGPGTYKLPLGTPCKGPSCTPKDCCRPNPTCMTIKGCPTGRQFKPNHKKIPCDGERCKQNECCDPIPQPNCLNFTCQQNATLAPNYMYLPFLCLMESLLITQRSTIRTPLTHIFPMRNPEYVVRHANNVTDVFIMISAYG